MVAVRLPNYLSRKEVVNVLYVLVLHVCSHEIPTSQLPDTSFTAEKIALSEVSIQKVILCRHQREDNLVHCLPPILVKGDCNGVYVCIGILVYVVTTSSKSLNQVGVYLKAFPSFTSQR